MQDQLKVLWQKIEKNLRVVIILVFLALLGIVFYLYSTESPDISESPPTAANPPNEDSEDTEFEAVQKIQDSLYAEPTPIDDTALSSLTQRNIFSPEAAREAAGEGG